MQTDPASVIMRTRCSGHPGAAVPVRLDPAGKAPRLEVQLVRQPPEPRREEQLEAFACGDAAKLLPLRRLAGGRKSSQGAAAARLSRPHVQAASTLVDQLGRRL